MGERLAQRIGAARAWLRQHPALPVLLALSLIALAVFVPPNLVGTADLNMLAAFQQDEYVQFATLSRMLTIDPSPLDTLVDLIVYRHYFYGYPFYVISALFTLPIWLGTGLASPADLTPIYMLALRQMSLVGVCASIIMLVWMWTRFRHVWGAAFLFLFLLTIPSVTFNSSWWHPDGIISVVVTLTIFALYRDNLRFGRWFNAAAIFCGLATATKVVGLFFFLTIAVYLLMGLRQGRLTPLQMLRKGAIFVALMVATVIVLNPLLLIPRTSKQIITTMFLQATSESQRGTTRGPLAWYNEVFRNGYGFWWLYLAVFAAAVAGVFRRGEQRLLYVLILTWALPFTLYCITVVTFKKSYYFIPIALPLFSCIIDPQVWNFRGFWRERRWLPLGLASALLVIYLANVPHYLSINSNTYRYLLNRERESEALAFYRALDTTYLDAVPDGVRMTIFRDPYVYVRPSQQYDVHMKWGAATYGDIAPLSPDLILLQRSYVERYGQPSEDGQFYYDAGRGELAGYRLLIETDFGLAFVRNEAAAVEGVRP